MRSILIAILCLSFFSISAFSQTVYVKGSSDAATVAKTSLNKYTQYRLSNNADHSVLVVREETWSQTLLSQPTTAISMRLISDKGRLLWSKTDPVGTYSVKSVVQDLLKQLAKARLKVSGRSK